MDITDFAVLWALFLPSRFMSRFDQPAVGYEITGPQESVDVVNLVDHYQCQHLSDAWSGNSRRPDTWGEISHLQGMETLDDN